MKWNIRPTGPGSLAMLSIMALLLCPGCKFMKNMYEQPKYLPLQPGKIFEDGRSARRPPEGAVAQGNLRINMAYYAGMSPAGPVETLQEPLNRELLLRGQARFNVFCSPCHDRTGSGTGMIVNRGFTVPPSYHIERLRTAPIGHFFDVMTHGFGAMPDYASQVPVRDRWAIAAYIRTLQFSAYAPLSDLSESERRRLEGEK